MFEHKILFMASREPAFASPNWNRDFYRALGRAIKVARTERGLERKELARLSGFSYPYLAEIEKGVKRPSTEALIPIARALGLKQSELLQLAERRFIEDTCLRHSLTTNSEIFYPIRTFDVQPTLNPSVGCTSPGAVRHNENRLEFFEAIIDAYRVQTGDG